MFEAQLIFGKSGDPAVYSPWVARRGDSAIAVVDVIAIGGGVKLLVEMFTKKAEDAGDGSALGLEVSATSAGRVQIAADGGMNDLVRFRFTASSGAATEWILFRMLSPVWFDGVKA